MPWKPKIRAPLIKCGSCPKSYRVGDRHTCVTRLDRKGRKPRKTKVTGPRVQIWSCPDCGKPAGLGHSCRKRTDFRKRKQAQAKAERDREKQEAAERKKAAAAKKRSESHDPEDCEDEEAQAADRRTRSINAGHGSTSGCSPEPCPLFLFDLMLFNQRCARRENRRKGQK